MGEVVIIGTETIMKEELDKEAEDILNLLKIKKRTYQMNKSILQHAINKLEQKATTTIFH